MATYDNITYFGACNSFHNSIINGNSQPYPRELKIIKLFLDKNPNSNNTFIDIGAHIGTTSIPYSKLFRNVICYEPNLSSFNSLKQNIEYNNCKNISIYNLALSDENTFCDIIDAGGNSGCFYIKKNNNGTTQTKKIDNETFINKIDFIKIDTEGNELAVLKGAINLIKKDKPLIQVETNHLSNLHFNYDKSEIFDLLYNLGYIILDDNGNDPIFIYNNI